jgi:hypothetical protein
LEILGPFKSEAQGRYFEANKAKLEKDDVNVKEWSNLARGRNFGNGPPQLKRKRVAKTGFAACCLSNFCGLTEAAFLKK